MELLLEIRIDEGSSYPYLRNSQKPVNVTSINTSDVPSGAGTSAHPYIITTAQQLNNIKYDIYAFYKLGSDIDLGNTTWTPIADFHGNFDGNGYSIKNLTSTTKGLFDSVTGTSGTHAIIKNLTLTIKSINTSSSKVGGLVGSSSYLDISVVAVLNADSGTGINSSSNYIGGILGTSSSYNTITDSYAILPVNGSSCVGGLVGYTSARPIITRCYFAGTVTGNSGIYGLAGSATFTSSYYDSTVAGFSTGTGAKTTEQMKQQATFTGWDFVNVWNIDEGVTYPYFMGMQRFYPGADDPPKVELVGVNDTYIMLKAQFPRSGVNGNELKLYDSTTGQWRSFTGTSSSTADGIYTISGLTPLTTYQCSLIWYIDQTNSWLKRSIDINVATHSELTFVTIQELNQVSINEDLPFHIEGGTTAQLEGGITPQWGTSGYNTHETIARQASIILKNDKGDAIYNKINEPVWDELSQRTVNALDGFILPYVTLTDDIESDKTHILNKSTWVGHFYGPGGTNYLVEHPFLEEHLQVGTTTSPTAYQRFNDHYYDAVEHYKAGYKALAYRELGMAIHYLEDLNAPHHAANRIFGYSHHTDYEKWVDENINYHLFLITTAPQSSYDYVKESRFVTMADDWSRQAREYIDACDKSDFLGNFDSSEAFAPTLDCLTSAQRGAAALYYRFIANTNRLSP